MLMELEAEPVKDSPPPGNRSVGAVGAMFEIVIDEEFVVALEFAHVEFVANSSQIITSVFANCPANVLAVCPPITVLFLNHLKVLEPTASVSESESLNEPMLQSRVSDLFAGFGVIDGAVRDEAMSGKLLLSVLV